MNKYAHLKSLPDLCYYDELPEEKRALARQGVLEDAERSRRKSLDTAEQAWRANLHRAVNDPAHIRRVVHNTNFEARLKRNESYLQQSILGNLLMFKPNGDYYRFMPDQENQP